MGAGTRRDAADARAQPPARTHRRAGRRPDQDRPRRRRRRDAGRRRIRLLDGAAGRAGLHHDAQVPSQHLPGRHRHAGPGAAQALHRAARARHQLFLLRRRGSARADGEAGHAQVLRPDRPLRPARHAPRHRALEGEGPRFRAGLLSAGDAGGSRAPPMRGAGPRPRRRARPYADRGRGAGARAQGRRAPRLPHPQRASLGRRDAVRLGRAELWPRRAARRHHPRHVRRHRGPELRRVPRARHHLRAAGRDQRLRRQGAVRRPHRRLSRSVLPGEARGQHRHRQHGDVRRDRRRGLFPRRRGRALLRAQLRCHGGGRGHRRSRLRIHDGRHGRRARAHRAQFRRRDERRHRVRLRRGRHVRIALQRGDGGAGAAAIRGRPGDRPRRNRRSRARDACGTRRAPTSRCCAN